MIYSVRGKLIATEPGAAIVECGGVAFRCQTTMNTLRQLPPTGGEAMLYTFLNVRDDAMELFGFASRTELSCFRMLTGVTGVGAKAGLSILSSLAPEQVAMCVGGGDYKSLTRAPGVGPKLAQRIVLELKDKVKKLGAPSDAAAPSGVGVPSASAHAAEAINALTVLGYTPAEAAEAIARLDSALPTEELIRQALRSMAARL